MWSIYWQLDLFDEIKYKEEFYLLYVLNQIEENQY